ncbi:GumC family protein [Altericista sp. CCNU0014]|uniref:GumC family protein n=1 Tax=Altericista sp. CCNU0014 TaxID=3082949 RepID=UPI00384E3456
METPSVPSTGISDYRKLFKYHWLPAGAVFLSVLTLSIVMAYVQKPTYTAASKLKLNRENPVSSLTDLGKSIDNMASVTETSNPVLTETQVIQSQPILEQTLQQLGWALPDGKPFGTDAFLKQLSVNHVKDADILQIEFKDRDPKKAAEAVNTLMKVYLQSGVRSSQGEVNTARQFIAAQLPTAKKQVEAAESKLRRFKQTYQILTLKEQVTSAQVRIDGLQKQIADAQAQLANTSAQADVVIAKLGINPQEAVALSSLSQSPEIQDLLAKIQQTQSQLVLSRDRLTASHPTVVSLEGNLEDLKQLFAQKAAKISGSSAAFDPDSLIGKLRQDLTAQLVGLEASRKGLQQEIATQSENLRSYREQVALLPTLEQQQNELERQLDVAQNSYGTLLKKFQETQVASNQAQGNVRIVAEAVVPDRPTTPRKPLYAATGFILGSVLAFLTLYGLESLNKSLRTIEEVRRQLNLPIFGVIPFVGQQPFRLFHSATVENAVPTLYLVDFPDCKASEAYRLLQSNLQSLGKARPCKVLAITSTLAQEGTSTVAANLAIALAQNGRSAILVEANFQDPIQEYIWAWPADRGLGDILVDQTPWHTVVQRIFPNLDLIFSGNSGGPAISRLDSPQMAALLADLSDRYDYVILDTAALKTGTDTVRLAQLVDGILLVARPGKIDIDSAVFVQQVLAQMSKPALGLVLNQVQPIHEPDPYYFIASPQSDPTSKSSGSELLRSDGLESQPPFQELDRPVADRNDSLEQIPLDRLQGTIETLQKDWIKSARLVREQEEELSLQSQTVREMHEKLNAAREYHRHAASEYERLSLEVQLVDEEERQRLLDKTLIGQRRKLLQQQEILQQHLRVLEQRRQSIASHPPSDPPPRPLLSQKWLKHLRS